MLLRLFLPFLMLGRADFPVFVVCDFRVFTRLGYSFVVHVEGALKRYVPFVQKSLERSWDTSELLAMRALHPGKEGITLSNGRPAGRPFREVPAVFKIVMILDRPHSCRISFYMVGSAKVQ